MLDTEWQTFLDRALALGIQRLQPTEDVVDSSNKIAIAGIDKDAAMWLGAIAVFNIQDYPTVWDDILTNAQQRVGQLPTFNVQVFITDTTEEGRWLESYSAIEIAQREFESKAPQDFAALVYHEYVHGIQHDNKGGIQYDNQFEDKDPWDATDDPVDNFLSYFRRSEEMQAYLEQLAFESRQGASEDQLRSKWNHKADGLVKVHPKLTKQQANQLRQELYNLFETLYREKDRYMVAVNQKHLEILGVLKPLRSFVASNI